MREPIFYWACFAIIVNEKGNILFQKRQNTWFRDWKYQLPAWHMDWKETMKDAMIREAKEELWINILEEDLEIKHICHRIGPVREYFDIYLEVKNYSLKIINNEPEKCSSLDFIDINNIKEPELFAFDLNIIKKIEKWIYFSEL